MYVFIIICKSLKKNKKGEEEKIQHSIKTTSCQLLCYNCHIYVNHNQQQILTHLANAGTLA